MKLCMRESVDPLCVGIRVVHQAGRAGSGCGYSNPRGLKECVHRNRTEGNRIRKNSGRISTENGYFIRIFGLSIFRLGLENKSPNSNIVEPKTKMGPNIQIKYYI